MMENLKNPHDSIKADDLNQLLQATAKPLLVDVRPPDMFAKSHIDGSVNIPQEELSKRSDELPGERDAAIVMLCGIGKVSKSTVLYLKSMGYRNVRNMKGGVNEWVRKGHPTSSGPV